MSLSAALISPIMCGTVLVADDDHARDAVVGDRRLAVVACLGEERVHPFERTFETLEGWPSHVGIAMIRISDARMRARIAGHSSSSEMASEITRSRSGVYEPDDVGLDDSSGERLRVQTRQVARIRRRTLVLHLVGRDNDRFPPVPYSAGGLRWASVHGVLSGDSPVLLVNRGLQRRWHEYFTCGAHLVVDSCLSSRLKKVVDEREGTRMLRVAAGRERPPHTHGSVSSQR